MPSLPYRKMYIRLRVALYTFSYKQKYLCQLESTRFMTLRRAKEVEP